MSNSGEIMKPKKLCTNSEYCLPERCAHHALDPRTLSLLNTSFSRTTVLRDRFLLQVNVRVWEEMGSLKAAEQTSFSLNASKLILNLSCKITQYD